MSLWKFISKPLNNNRFEATIIIYLNNNPKSIIINYEFSPFYGTQFN